MEYLKGYTIKPHEVTPAGEVHFTDGTNTGIRANQVTCEAYGYTYDRASGTCRAFNYNINLNRIISNIDNKNNGAGNITENGSTTIQINGTNNTASGRNSNCLINGSNNEIANGVNNSTVLGKGGRSDRDGELVIGGGLEDISADADTNSFRKVSVVNLAGTTTDNTATNLTVNGSGGTNYINVNENSIVGFEIYITRLEVGGSASTGGN